MCGALSFGQTPPGPPPQSAATISQDRSSSEPQQGDNHGPIDVLSDTKGLDFHHYVDKILPKIQANWYKRVPDSARVPIMKKGKVRIAFRLMKDGKITDVQTSKPPETLN
jgi:hypothetical protein